MVNAVREMSFYKGFSIRSQCFHCLDKILHLNKIERSNSQPNEEHNDSILQINYVFIQITHDGHHWEININTHFRVMCSAMRWLHFSIPQVGLRIVTLIDVCGIWQRSN